MINLHEACIEYVELLNSPPNGWGQHIHPVYGQSHNLLRKLYNGWNKALVDETIEKIFSDIRNWPPKSHAGLK